jgi:inhibitor of KinA sporulation pathway (predicted exonuclease)
VVVEPEVQKVESEKGYYLVIDLEATCFDKWEEKPREELEIIEIGAALVDDKTLEVVSTFDGIIQPKLYPSLSAYCRQLTGITQEMVDNASSFSVVLENFMVWQSMFPGTKKFCSWGEYDKNQLKADCHRAGVELPDVLTEHFNIKKLYTEKYNNKGLIGLGKAMKKMKLEFVGSPHRGIDDAINIAAVLKKLLTEPS